MIEGKAVEIERGRSSTASVYSSVRPSESGCDPRGTAGRQPVKGQARPFVIYQGASRLDCLRSCCGSGWLGSVLRPQSSMHWGRSTDPSHPLTFVDDGKWTRCKRESLYYSQVKSGSSGTWLDWQDGVGSSRRRRGCARTEQRLTEELDGSRGEAVLQGRSSTRSGTVRRCGR